MKKILSISVVLVGLGFFLSSCSELRIFQSKEGEQAVVEPKSVDAVAVDQTSKNIKVVLKTVTPSGEDYYLWNSLLGTNDKKTLTWKDAANLSPRQLFFVKDGFSLESKKYAGSLVVERDKSNALRLLNEISIETYLRGVIPSEMPASWPIEALKAQAVVARTYALYDFNETAEFLESSVMDQVYQGEKSWKPSTNIAVQTTEGETLAFKGKMFPSYFHSASGGITTTVPHVWPKKQNFPVLESVKDEYSTNSPNQNWSTELSPWQIVDALNKKGIRLGELKSIQVVKRDPTGRVAVIKIEGSRETKVLEGNDFRLILGWKNLKSTLFTLNAGDGTYIFKGHGFGHGVGLSQWGAKAMAEKGFNYKQILKFYFPKAEIK